MPFQQEPSGYNKTILSDLQGSWLYLRSLIVELCTESEATDVLFHIDEAMSWESVRNLAHMKGIFLIVQNKLTPPPSAEIAAAVEELRDVLYETLDEIGRK